MRVEHECAHGGAWAYLAALDVHGAKLFGRCDVTGIAPSDRLVAPYDRRSTAASITLAGRAFGDGARISQ